MEKDDTTTAARIVALCHDLAKLALSYEVFCEKRLPYTWRLGDGSPAAREASALRTKQAALLAQLTELLGSEAQS